MSKLISESKCETTIDRIISTEQSEGNVIDAENNLRPAPKLSTTHIGLKYMSVILFVVQRVIRTSILRYASTKPDSKYIKSTFVFVCEIEKGIMNLILVIAENRSIIIGFKTIFKTTINELHILMKLFLIAAVYTLQNNVRLFAISKLNIATYEVTSQLKLLTTAIFSRLLLNRRLNVVQWFGLVLLLVGVSIVEYEQITSKKATEHDDPISGFVAILIICVCSGFAGVFFEKILKHYQISLWILNVQLTSWSIVMSLILMFTSDGKLVRKQGMFYGYSRLIWISTIIDSFGGLLVGIVIKYADTIVKSFASSISIVVSCIVAIQLFDFRLTSVFTIGACLVILATMIYSNSEWILSIIFRKFISKR